MSMSRRVLVFGATTAVFSTALLVILSILDVVTAEQLRDSLGKTLLVVAVSTGAVAAMLAIGRLGRSEAAGQRSSDSPEPSTRD